MNKKYRFSFGNRICSLLLTIVYFFTCVNFLVFAEETNRLDEQGNGFVESVSQYEEVQETAVGEIISKGDDNVIDQNLTIPDVITDWEDIEEDLYETGTEIISEEQHSSESGIAHEENNIIDQHEGLNDISPENIEDMPQNEESTNYEQTEKGEEGSVAPAEIISNLDVKAEDEIAEEENVNNDSLFKAEVDLLESDNDSEAVEVQFDHEYTTRRLPVLNKIVIPNDGMLVLIVGTAYNSRDSIIQLRYNLYKQVEDSRIDVWKNNPIYEEGLEDKAYILYLKKGVYYLELSEYLYSISNSLTYTFRYFNDDIEEVEDEPNDSEKTATSVKIGRSYAGSACGNDRYDYYVVKMNADKYYSVSISDSKEVMDWNYVALSDEFGNSYTYDIRQAGGKDQEYVFSPEKTGLHYLSFIPRYNDMSYIPNLYDFKIVEMSVPQLTGVYNSVKGIDLRWKKVNGASGYEIWRKNRGVWTKVTRINGGDTTQYYDTEVKNEWGKIYVYSVAAVYGTTAGPYNEKGRGICRLKPTTMLSVTNISSGTIDVEWTASDKSSGYEIQYSGTSDFASVKKVKVEGRDTLKSTVSNVPAGKYYIRIRSFMTDSNDITYYSQYSNSMSVDVYSLPKVQAVAIYNSAKGADIRWKPITGIKYYAIWRKRTNPVTKVVEEKIIKVVDGNTCEKDGGNYKFIDTNLKDKYTDSGKEWEGGWVYYITAMNSSNQEKAKHGPISNKLNLYRLRNPVITSINSNKSGEATIEWTRVTNAHAYELQYSSDNGKTWAKVPLVEGEYNNKTVVTGLPVGRTINFRIRCKKDNANLGTTWSEYSKWKTITMPTIYTISNEVIVNNDDIKVTVVEGIGNWPQSHPGLRCLLENKNTDDDLLFWIRPISVNGYSTGRSFEYTVSARQEMECIIDDVIDYHLGMYGSSMVIDEFRFELIVHESDNEGEVIYSGEHIIYPTGLNRNTIQYPEQHKTNNEQVIYDNNVYSFVVCDYSYITDSETHENGSMTLEYYFENLSDSWVRFYLFKVLGPEDWEREYLSSFEVSSNTRMYIDYNISKDLLPTFFEEVYKLEIYEPNSSTTKYEGKFTYDLF